MSNEQALFKATINREVRKIPMKTAKTVIVLPIWVFGEKSPYPTKINY